MAQQRVLVLLLNNDNNNSDSITKINLIVYALNTKSATRKKKKSYHMYIYV